MMHHPEPSLSHGRQPRIIQGGMGVGVSSWKLARRVAELGEFGVVSGTGIDTVVARELQRGDPNGRLEVLRDYPDQEIVAHLTARFYVAGGIAEGVPFRLLPLHSFRGSKQSQRILSACTFSEVALARAGHDGLIGINLLTKLKRYTLACMYGAMLAGVDAVFMGAGIPIEEVEQMHELASAKPARLQLDVVSSHAPGSATSKSAAYFYCLDPADLVPNPIVMTCPSFYPVIASDSLARIIKKKVADERIAGWIVEGSTAGGHNAPPRNKATDDRGDPLYDDRDQVDLRVIAALGKPFYLAGGHGCPQRLQEALALGAAGIQVGSLFSLANESGYPVADKRRIIAAIHREEVAVRTDGRWSATGFPFKVMELDGTLGMLDLAAQRPRICDLGYLQTAYIDSRGRVRGRCPGEPTRDYLSKGGAIEDTAGRGCLCNALMANIGLGQQQRSSTELPLFTVGDGILDLALGSCDEPCFSVADVIAYLRGEATAVT
jgi:NAD(P)H-dependent flavin oxidoreductase YrpB (nitropropane dioxygenase family)